MMMTRTFRYGLSRWAAAAAIGAVMAAPYAPQDAEEQPAPPPAQPSATAEDAEPAAKETQEESPKWTSLSLDDLLLRRLEPGPLDLKQCWREAGAAARELGSHLAWNDSEIKQAAAELRDGITRDLGAAGIPLPD